MLSIPGLIVNTTKPVLQSEPEVTTVEPTVEPDIVIETILTTEPDKALKGCECHPPFDEAAIESREHVEVVQPAEGVLYH